MRRFAFMIIFLMGGLILAQNPPVNRKKPVLIRDDQTQSTPEEEVILPDPAQAKENTKIGDFYFKRKNFKAAADRYQEAIKYGPKWMEPYLKLSDALERMDKFQEAIDACQQFLEISDDAHEIAKVNERLQKLERKLQSSHGS